MRVNKTLFERGRALVVLTVGTVMVGSLGLAKAQRFQTRFDALDINGDGRISMNEWLEEGSRREFERLDLNGDGFLSPRELARSAGNRSTYGITGDTVIVHSADRWTDTGVSVQAGDIVTLDATGSIVMSDNPEDVATPAGARSGRLAPDAPLRTNLAGMLIARIGNSAPIPIGEHRTMRAPRSGQLYLGVNDDHLPDNRGEYRVSVMVEPR